jgi:hypothetical protein
MAIEAGGPITKQQRAFLDFIEENVRRMNKLVDDLDDSLSHSTSKNTPILAQHDRFTTAEQA